MNDLSSQEEIKNLIAENKTLKKRLERMSKEMKNFVALHDHALKLRDYSEREKNLQYEYNILLLENAPDMLFVMDPEIRLRLSTKSFLRFFDKGEDYGKLKGSTFDDLFSGVMTNDWIVSTKAKFEFVINNRQQIEYNDNLVINGDRKVFSISIAPAIDSSGKVMGAICLMHDSTELVRMKEAAEAATHAKSSFLASMSHEIRTPMNAIKGFSDLMARTSLSSKQKTYVDNISVATSSLLVIINDILDFSRIEASRYKIVNMEYDTINELSKLCGLMQPKSDERNLYFVVDIDPNLPSLMIGDAQRIQQILLNIINNALKFTHTGGIVLSVYGEPIPSGNWIITYTVKDTGQGIKPDEMPIIFQAFEQADYFKNKNISGTGLGLSISQGLAKLMDGDIYATSEYGVGSEFSLKIPQIPTSEAKIAYAKDPEKKNVLIYCTQEIEANFIGRSLNRLGIRHIFAHSSEKPFEAVQASNLTHIITDNFLCAEKTTNLYPHLQIGCIRNISDPDHNMPGNVHVLLKPILIDALADFINNCTSNLSGSLSNDNSAPTANFENARVLIVDDNEINLIVASEIIGSYDIAPKTAYSGTEAINMLRCEEFDIVFMDHMMPGMDGIEATGIIRAMDIRQPVIIALTANAIMGTEDIYINAGFDDYITKPIDMCTMNNTLKKWLSL